MLNKICFCMIFSIYYFYTETFKCIKIFICFKDRHGGSGWGEYGDLFSIEFQFCEMKMWIFATLLTYICIISYLKYIYVCIVTEYVEGY